MDNQKDEKQKDKKNIGNTKFRMSIAEIFNGTSGYRLFERTFGSISRGFSKIKDKEADIDNKIENIEEEVTKGREKEENVQMFDLKRMLTLLLKGAISNFTRIKDTNYVIGLLFKNTVRNVEGAYSCCKDIQVYSKKAIEIFYEHYDQDSINVIISLIFYILIPLVGILLVWIFVKRRNSKSFSLPKALYVVLIYYTINTVLVLIRALTDIHLTADNTIDRNILVYDARLITFICLTIWALDMILVPKLILYDNSAFANEDQSQSSNMTKSKTFNKRKSDSDSTKSESSSGDVDSTSTNNTEKKEELISSLGSFLLSTRMNLHSALKGYILISIYARGMEHVAACLFINLVLIEFAPDYLCIYAYYPKTVASFLKIIFIQFLRLSMTFVGPILVILAQKYNLHPYVQFLSAHTIHIAIAWIIYYLIIFTTNALAKKGQLSTMLLGFSIPMGIIIYLEKYCTVLNYSIESISHIIFITWVN